MAHPVLRTKALIVGICSRGEVSAQVCNRRFVTRGGVKSHVQDDLARRCVVDHGVVECRLSMGGR